MCSLRARTLLQVVNNSHFEWRGFRLAHFLTTSGSVAKKQVKLNKDLVKFTTFTTCIQRTKYCSWSFGNGGFSSSYYNLNRCAVLQHCGSKTRNFPLKDFNLNKLHSCAVLNASYRGKNKHRKSGNSKTFKGKPGFYSGSSKRYRNARHSGYSDNTDLEHRFHKVDGIIQSFRHQLHKGMLCKASVILKTTDKPIRSPV